MRCGAENGFGKLVVTDCAGNTACAIVQIDVDPPVCAGFNFSNRTLASTHAPIHVPDNQPSGPGVDADASTATVQLSGMGRGGMKDGKNTVTNRR